jgi:hypothetical protein
MRPVEVTDEAIIEAGRALVEQGRNVTGFALRKVIGSGAPNRLKAVWDRIRPRALPHPNHGPCPMASPVCSIDLKPSGQSNCMNWRWNSIPWRIKKPSKRYKPSRPVADTPDRRWNKR